MACFPAVDEQERHEAFMQLKGVAARRGDQWAEDLRGRVDPSLPWPHSERMLTIARIKVEDLAPRDERLLELLASECAKWAERRWDRLRATAPTAGSVV